MLELSVIIPAYNEEKRLANSLARIREFLGLREVAAEFIVVDDGSTDGTASLIESWRARIPQLRLVSNGRNRGKGFSVRHGMLEARGRIALFTDADLSTPMDEGEKLIQALRPVQEGGGGFDVAIGSRALDRTLIEVHQSAFRETAGIIFNKIVQLVTGVGFVDTQCGFKTFRMPECRVIFEQQRIEGFGFDPEVLFLAKRHGLRAIEIPVRWRHDTDTKVNVFRDSLRMFRDLLLIRWNSLAGRYPRHQALP